MTPSTSLSASAALKTNAKLRPPAVSPTAMPSSIRVAQSTLSIVVAGTFSPGLSGLFGKGCLPGVRCGAPS